MNSRQERFIKLLETIFELDKSDLDFGIYRIMNIRRSQILDFLKNGLPQKISETLEPFSVGSSDEIKVKIAEIEKKASDAGFPDVNTLPDGAKMKEEYIKLVEQLKSGTDLSALESDVYSALYSFFSRYYEEGDFISKRRYKEGVYSVPYEGEEVKLYWANHDQYYIKTSENFKDYSFNADDLTVHFRLVDATTEMNNNKEAETNKRVFMLYDESDEYLGLKTFQWDSESRELIIRFIYDLPKDKTKKYFDENLKSITSYIVSEHKDLVVSLLKNVSTDTKKPLTLIEKHLKAYVAKNEFDYFIHKDLRAFLTRELDFFIKNEVMHLDDLDTEREALVETYLAKIKAVKKVGKIIIDFLAQIEDFQKKLWLKKKFVVETNWCITLDHVDEKFYDEIIANKSQIQEWIDMYAINEIKADISNVGYSDPLSIEFLKDNQHLILDTKHFSQQFKDSLIASIDRLDDATNGVMFHSENFQALNFIQNRYRKSIQTVYIDPPYNTVYSEIIYKNNYKHSSWLSLLNNTMPLVPNLWTDDFSYGLAIDDYEFINLSQLVDMNFPTCERSTVIVNHHPQGAGGRLSRTHEYYILVSSPASPAYLGEPVDDYQEDRNFMRSGTGENNFRYGRWKSFYALLQDPITKKIVDSEDPIPLGEEYPIGPNENGLVRIYPINSRGEERVWRSSFETGRKRARNGELFVTDRGAVYQSIDHEAKREVLFSNWTDTKFNAGTQGSNLLSDMGLGSEFSYPKSIMTLETGLWAQTYGRDNGYILDYFAGSGTTGHAVINMNRKYGGDRKYILVEMGEYFNKATQPRIKKAIYSSEWKNGKPLRRDTGMSHIMKYMRLESYEDALSNIETVSNEAYSSLFAEDYLINYMLELDSKDSLLNVKAFLSPFDYRMKVTEKNECVEKTIDVCETFNYLVGLSVSSQSAISYYKASPAKTPVYEGAVDLKKDKGGKYAFRQIEGTLPDGRRALVIWRTISDDVIESNAALDAYFAKYRINPLDREYDVIFVNGDNNLENLRMNEESWKVMLTEEEFNKRMFEEA